MWQVADLDDEFAELLLGEYGEDFDAVPAGKVRIYLFVCTCAPCFSLYWFLYIGLWKKNAIVIEYPVAGGSEESDISSQGGAGIVWKLSEK